MDSGKNAKSATTRQSHQEALSTYAQETYGRDRKHGRWFLSIESGVPCSRIGRQKTGKPRSANTPTMPTHILWGYRTSLKRLGEGVTLQKTDISHVLPSLYTGWITGDRVTGGCDFLVCCCERTYPGENEKKRCQESPEKPRTRKNQQGFPKKPKLKVL